MGEIFGAGFCFVLLDPREGGVVRRDVVDLVAAGEVGRKLVRVMAAGTEVTNDSRRRRLRLEAVDGRWESLKVWWGQLELVLDINYSNHTSNCRLILPLITFTLQSLLLAEITDNMSSETDNGLTLTVLGCGKRKPLAQYNNQN